MTAGIAGTTGVDIFYDDHPADAVATRINSPPSPLRAGEDITDGYWRCTSNFDAVNGAPHYFLITAGHCFTNAADNVSMNSATSNTDLGHYAASKRLGTPDGSPVDNGATVSCDCESIGPVAASSVRNNEFSGPLTGADTRGRTHVAYNNTRCENSPHVCLSGVSEAAAYGQITCGDTHECSYERHSRLGDQLFHQIHHHRHILGSDAWWKPPRSKATAADPAVREATP